MRYTPQKENLIPRQALWLLAQGNLSKLRNLLSDRY